MVVELSILSFKSITRSLETAAWWLCSWKLTRLDFKAAIGIASPTCYEIMIERASGS